MKNELIDINENMDKLIDHILEHFDSGEFHKAYSEIGSGYFYRINIGRFKIFLFHETDSPHSTFASIRIYEYKTIKKLKDSINSNINDFDECLDIDKYSKESVDELLNDANCSHNAVLTREQTKRIEEVLNPHIREYYAEIHLIERGNSRLSEVKTMIDRLLKNKKELKR